MEDPRTQAARTHFDRWSETYEQDRAARRLREIQTHALRMLGLQPGDVLLDLGCGTGAATREAATSVARAVGFAEVRASTIWGGGYAFVRAERRN